MALADRRNSGATLRVVAASLSLVLLVAATSRGDDSFPIVPDDVAVSLFARDPLVRNPCAIAFDRRGRLCVGMGPQYRRPRPETPGDSVYILIDEDGDGRADRRKRFATGFNCIQGLAWRGDDLWVANAPDMTIVRDLDGDDVADEYVRLWTDLGNLEHGLHGLNWAPDGKLYMSKGNSKGLTQPPDRLAPRPFRTLWDVDTADLPDAPPPRVFTADTYRKSYHDPSDDWGRQGGILRCDERGENLEIFARGFRNPWDIAFDDGFDWLGTDNDQTHGDKIFSPFWGAQFGWGHAWSYDWKGDDHLPTAPSSGPLFEGSGTGVTHCALERYPARYRNVFLINDWLRREVYIYRPHRDGARLVPRHQPLEVLAHAGGGRSMERSRGRIFDPVDIVVGPDEAIYISSWGREYGATFRDGEQTNAGHIYRLWPRAAPPRAPGSWRTERRDRPLATWSLQELLADLGSHLPVWRTDAQAELVRRAAAGDAGVATRLEQVLKSRPSRSLETWAAWTLGLTDPGSPELDSKFAELAGDADESLNLRLQALRILARRAVWRPLVAAVDDAQPRVRLEAILGLRQIAEASAAAKGASADSVPGGSAAEPLVERLAVESDRLVYYAAWGALRALLRETERRELLDHPKPAVRRGALLSLLENDALEPDAVRSLARDSDAATAALAQRWLGGKAEVVIKGRPLRARGSRPAPPTRPAVSFLRDLRCKRGPDASYRLARLRTGERAYGDRDYRFTEVPEELDGDVLIQTANDDADARHVRLLFTLQCPATILVAHDVRIPRRPAWLDTFEPTDLAIATDDTRLRLFEKAFPPGEVALGANADDGQRGGRSQYVVLVRPELITAPQRPTAVGEVIRRLDEGDPHRGRDLFHLEQGAGCHACHRLDGAGKVYAPDLAGIGERADAEFIVRSILEPGAAITEGFTTQVFTTRAGEIHRGIVVEETGRAIGLVLSGGELVHLPQEEIIVRQSELTSAMPSFAETLRPRDVADLVAYLRAPRTQARQPDAPVVAAGKTTPAGNEESPTRGVRLERKDRRLEILIDGQRVATYHFAHTEISRPFFANVRTPGPQTVQVSRNFPPVEGVDATDHSNMHPGIWLAFGDIGGADVWRLRARVESSGPLELQSGRDRASFRVRNRYSDGERVICEETCKHSIVRHSLGYFVLYDSVFESDRADFHFGDQEEMGLGIRVATSLAVENGGSMRNSAGGVNERGTWGRAADWLDYGGEIDERRVGMTLLSHPKNFRQPWFHSRDYGAAVLNPFGRAAMRQGARSKVVVKRGESFRFRTGVLVHASARGDEADLEKAYRAFVQAFE